MTPDNYVVIHNEDGRDRIFVLFTSDYGDFVLTKSCKGKKCGCIGCLLFKATVGNVDEQYPVLDIEGKK
ncbi:hypothetical protein, partial [Salinivibrio kushneri]